MSTGIYVVGVVSSRVSGTRPCGDAADLVLAVTAVGERMLVRNINNAIPREFESRVGISWALERVRTQYPEAAWRLVDKDELRRLQGKPPTRARREKTARTVTRAEHIHHADQAKT